jgi:hypothetical protein
MSSASTHRLARHCIKVLATSLIAYVFVVPSVAATTDCRVALLHELGWRLAIGSDETPRIDAGMPCERASLPDAHAHGDLRAVVSRDGPTSAELDALLEHPATRCAFSFALGDATRKAIDKLAANPGYRFTAVQLGWIGFGRGGAAADGWETTTSFRRTARPLASPADAIAAFYTGTIRSECGVGRQIAQYATQRELYGAEAFDREFARDEIVIGTFVRLHRTRSILLGSGAGELVGDGLAKKASALGRQAFVGTPGFLVHAFDREFIDDLNNQAQNFVVYDVDAAAAQALRAHDGFAHYNAINETIWQHARAMRITTNRAFERLLVDRERNLRGRLNDTQRAQLGEIERLLDDPFYRGFRIYVHHHGVRDVAYHLARMLDRNSRTPYKIELALSNVRTTLFQRYVSHRLRACGGDSPVSP